MKRPLFVLGACLALLACFLFFAKSLGQEATGLDTPGPDAKQATANPVRETSDLASPEANNNQRLRADPEVATTPAATESQTEAEAPEPQVKPTGRLHGIVVLGDGTPAKGVMVRAQWSANDPTTKQGKQRVRTNEYGLFTFENLRVGNYRMTTSSPRHSSPSEIHEFETGANNIRLEIDALLVTFRNVAASGENATMDWLQISTYWENGNGGASASKTTFPEPRESYENLLSTQAKYVVRSGDDAGQTYFGLIESGKPSGRFSVDLIHDCPNFGALVLHVNQAALPEQATLELSSLEANGVSSFVQISPARAQQGLIRIPVGGLLPGDYKLELVLDNAGYVALNQDKPEVSIDAGGVHNLYLDTTVGGILKVQVHSSIEVKPHTQSDLEYRKFGGREWAPLWVITVGSWGEGDTSIMGGNSAFIGAPPSVTAPLPPGHYTIRVSLPGHISQEQNVQVVLSETLDIEFTLHPE